MKCCENIEVETLETLVKRVVKINRELGIDYDHKVCEECGELIAALMQVKTKKNDGNYFEVRGEMADVITTILVWMYKHHDLSYLDVIDGLVRGRLIRTIDRFVTEDKV